MSNVICPFCNSEFDPETGKGSYPPKEPEPAPAPSPEPEPAPKPEPVKKKGPSLGKLLDPFSD